jgi:predicted Zn-dependent protease
MIFISHPGFPAWRIAVSDPLLTKALEAREESSLAEQLQLLRGVQRRGVMGTLGGVLLLCAFFYGIYLLKDPAVKLVAELIPLEWEQAAGEKLFTLHKASSEIFDKGEVQDKFDKFIEPLENELRKTGYEPHVFVQQSEELNAFALPGGYVVINSEVIERAETPEEVLGVVAHEFAHVSERHVLRGLVSTIGIYFGVSIIIGDYAGSFAALGDALPHLISLSFSRDYEREADDVGVLYLQRAKIDPRGMIAFFKKIKAEEEKLAEISDLQGSLSFLSTHPNTAERIDRLKSRLGERASEEESAGNLNLQKEFAELKKALADAP